MDRSVVPGPPVDCFNKPPVKAVVAAMPDAGLPATVPQTARTFVCSHVFVGRTAPLQDLTLAPCGGHVHLPSLPEQVARHPATRQPHLPHAAQMQAVWAALAKALRYALSAAAVPPRRDAPRVSKNLTCLSGGIRKVL
jgi:pyroglutamyl-peptidase